MTKFDRLQQLYVISTSICYKITACIEDPTDSNWTALLTAIEDTALANPSVPTPDGYNIRVDNNTATVIGSGGYNLQTATTLCRMINSHIADDMVLKHVEHDVIEVEYFDSSDNKYVYRTFVVDPDGYVVDTTEE